MYYTEKIRQVQAKYCGSLLSQFLEYFPGLVFTAHFLYYIMIVKLYAMIFQI